MSIDPEERGRAALDHILQAINRFRIAVDELTFSELQDDPIRYAAAERFVEIISEASRRIPDPWKTLHPEIPWQDIAAIGNLLRHRYDTVDEAVIFELQGEPLAALERAVLRMKHAYSH